MPKFGKFNNLHFRYPFPHFQKEPLYLLLFFFFYKVFYYYKDLHIVDKSIYNSTKSFLQQKIK